MQTNPATSENRIALRKLMISLALRNQKPGSGSSIEFLRKRTTMIAFPNLNNILFPLKWAVVGAGATRLYMPERMTDDLDILILTEDDQEVQERLKKAGYTYHGQLAIGGSQWISPENFPLDVLSSDEKWVASALESAQTNRDGQNLPILPLPYLVLMKFCASRPQDIGDIGRMLGQATPEQLSETRQLFQKYLPDDSEDLESLVYLGQLELK